MNKQRLGFVLALFLACNIAEAQQINAVTLVVDKAHFSATSRASWTGTGALGFAIQSIPAGATAEIDVPAGYSEVLTSEIPVSTGAASLTIKGENGSQLIQGANSINLLHVMQNNVTVSGLHFDKGSFSGGTGVFVGTFDNQYQAGTASISGTTVTGSGTTWVPAMVGGIFFNTTGQEPSCVITAFVSPTSLVCPGFTGAPFSGAYAIIYIGAPPLTGFQSHDNTYNGMLFDTEVWNTDQYSITGEKGTDAGQDCFYTNQLLNSFPNGSVGNYSHNQCINPGLTGAEIAGNGFRWLTFDDNHTVCESSSNCTAVTGGRGGIISGGSPYFGGPYDQWIGGHIGGNSAINTGPIPATYVDGFYCIEIYGHDLVIEDNTCRGPFNTAVLWGGHNLSFLHNKITGSGVTSTSGQGVGAAFVSNVSGFLAAQSYHNTWIGNIMTNNQQWGIDASPGGGDTIAFNVDNRAPGHFSSDSTQTYYPVIAGGALPNVITGNQWNLIAPENGFSLSSPGTFSYNCLANFNSSFATGPQSYVGNYCNNQNATRFGNFLANGGNPASYFNGSSFLGNTAINLSQIGGAVTGLAGSTLIFANNQSLPGLGTPPAVSDFLTASGSGIVPQPTATVIFTPTGIGWYRVLTGVDAVSGQLEIYNQITDGRSNDVILDFAINGFQTNPGQINGTRFQDYTGGLVTQARISDDGSGNNYLDIYVSSATSPTPITLYFNGFGIDGFGSGGPVASPVVGATAAVNAKTVTVAPGFFSTEPFATSGHTGSYSVLTGCTVAAGVPTGGCTNTTFTFANGLLQ